MENSDRERILDDLNLEDFLKKYEDRILEIQSLINKPFETDLVNIEEQISVLCSKMEFIGWCLARAEEYITTARYRHLQPRKVGEVAAAGIILDHQSRKATLTRDIVKNLDKKIAVYLDKAQSVLAVHRMEMDKMGYGRKQI